MEHKEYRESKINNYPDRQTGLLMYRHEKLFDIVKTIEDFVNLSLNGEPSISEYKEFLNELMNKLPEEYKKIHNKKFEKYIKDYRNALLHTKYTKNIYPLLSKIYKYLEYMFNIEVTHNRSVKRYGATRLYDNSYIGKDEIGEFIKDTNRIKINKEEINQSIMVDESFSPEEKENNIIFNIEATEKHEFLHYLNNIGLLNEKLLNEKEYEGNNNIMSIYLLHRIKDEALAQIQDHIEIDDDINSIIDHVKEVIHGHYKQKYIRYFRTKYIRANFNGNKEYTLPDGFSELLKHISEVIIEEVFGGYKNIYIYTVDKGYYTDQQLIYLLSLTPLSQRQSLLDYYKKLNTLDQAKTDLHTTLSDD